MTLEAQRELPKYQSHKQVWALKIKELNYTGSKDQESDGSLMMVPEDGEFMPIKLDRKYVQKHQPKVGGYYVVYLDGYKSFSPAEPFESGYTKL